MSPIEQRVNAAQATPTGYIVPSGIRTFKERLKGADAGAAFMTWREQLFTKTLYRALQDMIVHPPREASHDDLLVQHGITLGLTLAAQLIVDPTVIWPDAFGPGMTAGGSSTDDRPPEEFTTSMDDALDDI